MPKHTLFIADLHLSIDSPKITKLFLHFLGHQAPQADALYILGDLFTLWAGDDDRTPFHEQIKAAIKRLSFQIPIYIMPGNRDFLLGESFASECGCQLINDPHKIDLYGRATLLAHGDIFCSKDLKHVAFRKLTQSKVAQKIFLRLPLFFRKLLANSVRTISSVDNRLRVGDFRAPQQSLINQMLTQYAVTQLIFGHIHQKTVSTFQLNRQNITQIILSDWLKSDQILIYYQDGSFAFQNPES